MNPIPLTQQGGDKIIGYACGVCKHYHVQIESATECCTCHNCGVEKREPHLRHCAECDKTLKQRLDEREREKERAAFEKAAKVPEAEYDGMVFWGDEYCDSVEDYIEACESNGETPREYVWACKPYPPTVSVSTVIDYIEEQAELSLECEDMQPFYDWKETETLKKALQEWLDKNDQGVVTPDYSRAVVLSEETLQEFRERMKEE